MTYRPQTSNKGLRSTLKGRVRLWCVGLCLFAMVLLLSAAPALAGGVEYWSSAQDGPSLAAGMTGLPAGLQALLQEHGGFGAHRLLEMAGRPAPAGSSLNEDPNGGPGLLGEAPVRSISGRVTGPGGVPVVDVEVDAYDEYGDPTDFWAFTDSNGDYLIEGLAPGSYTIATWNDQGLIDEWYDNVVLPGNGGAEGATLVDVTVADAGGMNFQLALGRSIAGRVTRSGGTPLAGLLVGVFDSEAEWLGGMGVTAGDGTYEVGGLLPGSYMVFTINDQGYIDEWYDNVILQGNWDGAGATLVDVTSGNATGKDFQLAAGKYIAGKVTPNGVVGLADVEVAAVDIEGNWIDSATTAANGTYTIRGLLPGSYKLTTSNDDGYIDEWYNDVIYQNNWEGAGATLVNVSSVSATNKNFQLALGRTISGVVTREGGAPLEGVEIVCLDAAGDYVDGAWTTAGGIYTVAGLLPGSYRIWTVNDQGYVDEWYGTGHVVRAGNEDGVGAAVVNVSVANATGISVDLLAGFTIAGDVTDSGSGQLEGGANRLEFFGSSGGSYGQMGFSSDGPAYESYALPPGTYYVRSWNESGYIDQWYSGLDATTNGLADANPVDLTTGNATGVDFALVPGLPVIDGLEPEFGSTAGGTEVEVWGTGFLRLMVPEGASIELGGGGLLGGSYGVTIDGSPVSYEVLSPNYMVITTPAHAAGDVQVQVNAAGGNSVATEASSFAYLTPASYNSVRGYDRYDTAIKMSKAMFPGALPPGSGLVVAPGYTFQEALCGAPLAAAWGGPMLLTDKTALYSNVKNELKRLAPTRVFCIGLSTAAVNGVRTALPGVTVTPINGTGLSANIIYDMSRKVANALAAKVGTLGKMTGATAIITRGDGFPDGIGVSPLACANFWPIILTNNGGVSGKVLHASAAATLAGLGITKALKVGTYATLPVGITGLANLSGVDRYDTNSRVAAWGEAFGGLAFTHTGMATGDKFPDALASGPYLAQHNGILLLSPLAGPLPDLIAETISGHRDVIEYFSFIAMVDPVVSDVKALLP